MFEEWIEVLEVSDVDFCVLMFVDWFGIVLDLSFEIVWFVLSDVVEGYVEYGFFVMKEVDLLVLFDMEIDVWVVVWVWIFVW